MNISPKIETPGRPFARRSRPSGRRGVTILIVIAFFAIAITLLGVWIRTALAERRQMQRWHQRVQATWLADSGLRRAAARLAREGTAYQGERWHIGPESLGDGKDAEVAIRVEYVPYSGSDSESAGGQAKESSRRVRLIATADYPAGSRRQVRFTKTTEVTLKIPGEQP